MLVGLSLLAAAAGWQTLAMITRPEPLPVLDTLGGDFTLDSTLGEGTRLSDFQGEVVLLNFGYTQCPDVCPTALSRMRDVIRGLPDERTAVRPVFVTLDPDRDSLDRIRDYVAFFDASFIGMTGSAEAIANATAPFKVYYQKEPQGPELGYSIAHSSHIYVIDPAGRVRTTFGPSVRVPDMISTVHQLQKEAG